MDTVPQTWPFFNPEYLFLLVYMLLTGQWGDHAAVLYVTEDLYPAVKTVLIFLTLLLAAGCVYAGMRILQIRAEEHKYYWAVVEPPEPTALEGPPKDPRWQRVIQHLSSENPGDWRLAIIEADIMLDDLTKRQGFEGATLGDRLKNAPRGDFKTLDKAWDAHKVRNTIAHEGSDFILTEREAKRVVALFQEVFEEFGII